MCSIALAVLKSTSERPPISDFRSGGRRKPATAGVTRFFDRLVPILPENTGVSIFLCDLQRGSGSVKIRISCITQNPTRQLTPEGRKTLIFPRFFEFGNPDFGPMTSKMTSDFPHFSKITSDLPV